MKTVIALIFLSAATCGFRSAHQERELRERALRGATTLRNIYVRTDFESARFTSVTASSGDVCFALVSEDACHVPSIDYAIFEKGEHTVRYGLDVEDVEGRCEGVGVQDFTEIVEDK